MTVVRLGGVVSGAFVLALTLGLVACGHSTIAGLPPGGLPQAIELANQPGSTFKVTLRNDLVQVDHDSVERSIVAMSSDGTSFVFSHPPQSIVGAKPGTTVLFSGLALRKISSVRSNGDFALVQTDPATLTDAISDGIIAWDHPITFGGGTPVSARGPLDRKTLPDGTLTRWIRSAALPALADESGAPVAVNHTGTANGWQYTTQTTVGTNQLNIDETLTRQDQGGMQIAMHAKGTLSNFNIAADIEIRDGQIVKFTYVNKNVKGTIDFQWTATKSESGVGSLQKSDRLVTLPPLASIPLDFEGFPFTLDIDSAMLVEPAFTGKDESTHGHFTVNFSGDQGFTIANGTTTRVGATNGDVAIDDDTSSLSPIAASAFVGALSLPKLELKPGIAPESLQPDNGAFADRAKQLLAQSGYASALASATSSLPSGGAYVQLITSAGTMNFGVADSLIPCEQTTMELSLKVGNAAGLGVSSTDPNETYMLKTWHRINPAVQYCAKGLASSSGSPATSPTSSPPPCDKSATGSATDFYGVPSGKVLQPFMNTYKSGGHHGGIDVQQLRDAPVFANLRATIPLAELNSALVLATQKPSGLGVPGAGDATLKDASVIVQPWYPGCGSAGSCADPSINDSYGGILGLAAHYDYSVDGRTDTLTIYVEYEHLVAPPYAPRKDDGTFVDNQNQPIATGEYAGCTGFGSQMTRGAKLTPAQLAQHPLIGFLGATQSPHVHIQTAFSLGTKGYLKSQFFDPGVVVSH